MDKDQCEYDLKVACMGLLEVQPFYGMILSNLKLVLDDNIEAPIACVNYKELRICCHPDREGSFFGLSSAGKATLLKHEICHVVYGHLDCPRNMKLGLANIVQDAVIHRTLLKEDSGCLKHMPEGIVTPIQKNGVYSGFEIGSGITKEIFEIDDFNEKDWMILYYDLDKQLQSRGEGGEKGFGQIDFRFEDVERIDEDSAEAFRQDLEKVIISVSNMCGDKCPDAFKRRINSLKESKVPWTTVLHNIVRTEVSKDDFCWESDSRWSHIMPAFTKLKSECIKDVVLAVDTSGSMSQKDLEQGLSEFKELRMLVPFRIHLVSADTEVRDVQTFEVYEEPEWETLSVKGGGGTLFEPVFEEIKNNKIISEGKPAILIYFTDMQGPLNFPEPDFPTVWVTNSENIVAPFGDTIVIDYN